MYCFIYIYICEKDFAYLHADENLHTQLSKQVLCFILKETHLPIVCPLSFIDLLVTYMRTSCIICVYLSIISSCPLPLIYHLVYLASICLMSLCVQGNPAQCLSHFSRT